MKWFLTFPLFTNAALAVIQITPANSTNVTPAEALSFPAIPNIRPANGAVPTNNPPLFSWPHSLHPTNVATENTENSFTFQLSKNADFSTPLVDVVTKWNFYNTIAPITNANGTPYTSTVYWRVGYAVVATGTTNGWITNTFTLSASASDWDRSMLANSTFLNARGTHPYMMFNATNRADVYAFMLTNDANGWLTTTQNARAAIDSAWWTTTPWPTDGTVEAESRDQAFRYVALAWGLTREAQWTNGLARNMTNCAKWFRDTSKHLVDHGGGDMAPNYALIHGYDLTFEIMNQHERTNVLASAHLMTRAFWGYGGFWRGTNAGDFTVSAPVDETYSGPFYVSPYSMAKMGTSHGYFNFMCQMLTALGTFNEDPMARDAFDLSANYLYGRTLLYGTYAMYNQGRSYNIYGLEALTYSLAQFAMAFPEAHFERVPFLRGNLEWSQYLIPPGFKQVNETWGDSALGTAAVWRQYYYNFAAKFAQDGNAWNSHKEQEVIDGTGGTLLMTLQNAVLPYYYRGLQRTTNNTLVKLFPEDGWVSGSSLPVNTAGAFTNGVMWNFIARPRGSESQHSHDNDGAYDYSAFGANCTEGGSDLITFYAKNPVAHNVIMISSSNGMVGPFYAPDGPRRSNYCRITHFTNGPGFTYARADLTYAYPHESFPVTGFQRGGYNGDSTTTVPQNHILAVIRHWLALTNGYFVIYDEINTSTNCLVSRPFHIYNAKTNGVASLDTSTGTFTWWVTNHMGDNVTNISVDIANVSGLTWANVVGSPGEDVKRSNRITASNAVPATTHRFLRVQGPAKPKVQALLTVTPHDNYTFTVNFDGDTKKITFDGNYAGALGANDIQIGTALDNPSGGGGAEGTTVNAAAVGNVRFQ